MGGADLASSFWTQPPGQGETSRHFVCTAHVVFVRRRLSAEFSCMPCCHKRCCKFRVMLQAMLHRAAPLRPKVACYFRDRVCYSSVHPRRELCNATRWSRPIGCDAK